MSQRSEELDQLWKIAVARIVFNIIWQGYVTSISYVQAKLFLFKVKPVMFRTPIFVSVISLWSYTMIAGNELTAATAFTSLLVFEELRVALNVLPHVMSDAMQVLVRYTCLLNRPVAHMLQSVASNCSYYMFIFFTKKAWTEWMYT